MPDYAVNTAFNASGDLLRKITNMTNGVNKFGRNSKRSFDQASRSASNFKSTMAGVLAANAVSKSLDLTRRGLASVTNQFIEYDQAIVSASAKFKGLNLTTKEGVKTLDELKKTARGLGATTEFSATQAAQGLDFLAMAGFNATQAMAALPGVVDLATVANTDLARATDIASDSIGAFGLMTEDATQLQKNFTRVNDVFAKTMTVSNTSMEDLFETVKSGAAAFTGAGQSLETFNSMVAVLANAGLKGAESGTALRNVMLRLSKPTGEAATLIKDMGVNIQDSQGNFRDAIDILSDFEKGLDGMGSAQRSAALNTIFGARSVTAVNNLMAAGTDQLRDYRDELINSAGASKKMSDVMRGSIGNQLKSLGSAASEMGFKFFDAFQHKIIPAIQSLTEFIRAVDVSSIVAGLTTVIDVVVRLKGALVVLIATLGAYKLAMAALGFAAFIRNLVLVTRFVRAAIVAQGVWNTIMMLNPIGIIITAIGLFVGALWLLVDNFDVVGAAIAGVFKWIGSMILKVIDIWMMPFKVLWEGMKKLVAFFGGGDDESPSGDMTAGDVSQKIEVADAGINQRQAPNESAVAVQQVNFNGQLNIAGAPNGSTFEDNSKGAPAIKTEMIGVQM